MTMVLTTDFAPAERAAAEDVVAQSRLFETSGLFVEAMRLIPGVVLILNEKRQTVYANKSALDAVGASSLKSILGMRPGEIFACKHSAERPGGCGTTVYCRYCGAVNAILTGQSGRAACEECRMTTNRGKDDSLDLRIWASPIEVEGQQFVFCTISDIADEKRRRCMERMFLHDLLSNMTALRGFCWLFDENEPDPAERRGQLRHVVALADQIIESVDMQKQLVLGEHDELAVNISPINSLVLLRSVHSLHGTSRAANHREVVLAENSRGADFESDETLLRRVLENMVKNAIEAANPGERVTLQCGIEADQVVFRIHNPGYMPEQVRMQVFNRSFSTKGTGRGLGTYTMKFLSERYLRGTVSFNSTESDGTTFTARYPVK